jgi:hypothetical protein
MSVIIDGWDNSSIAVNAKCRLHQRVVSRREGKPKVIEMIALAVVTAEVVDKKIAISPVMKKYRLN